MRILVKNFEGVFESEDCAHLKLFYIIIPPLTLNYIDHVQKAKDKLLKKNNKDAFLSDDGFPLGIAYLLKILDQIDLFGSLNWFDSMNAKFNRDIKGAGGLGSHRPPKIGGFEDDNMEEELSTQRTQN